MSKGNSKHKTTDVKNANSGGTGKDHGKVQGDQTRMPNEQDTERRSGNFEGAGEHSFRQPGKRQ
jgi:hypothetical protein